MNRNDYATALKDNPVFSEILEKLHMAVTAKELVCDPTDKELCQCLVITRRQIAQLQMNLNNIIEDEEAKIMLEAEPEIKPPVFKR